MSEIDLIEFQPWHLKLFKEGSEYDAAHLHPEIRASLYRHVTGATLLLDGEIAAIMGVVPLWNGVGELTFIPSDLFYKQLKTCVKVSRELLAQLPGLFDLHRLQATTITSCPKHRRFIEFFGFIHEGTLDSYGPGGESFEMYHYPIEEV